MTTQELTNAVRRIAPCGFGTISVTIKYRGKSYSCFSNDTEALDRIHDVYLPDRENKYGYTYKQALQALYDECKRKNDLI